MTRLTKSAADERAAVIRYLISLVDKHRVSPGYVNMVGVELQAAIAHIGNGRHTESGK